jgi:dihydrofolate synthase / folylpolyglutamate synthase
MYGLRRFGIKLGLDVIESMLAGLGNPQDQYRTVHIAGSNGKGSIAAMLTAILGEAGFSVGLYTSPHLVKFNERISINGRPIEDHEVVEAYEAVREAHQAERTPTFFEFTTAMAFWSFARHHVDWAVIETGMGGRLDATNIVNPEVAVISNISLEHQAYLGNTLASIAAEKGGIIKSGVPVISGVRQKRAREQLERIAAEKQAQFFRLGKDFRVRRRIGGTFSYYGLGRDLRDLRTSLQGEHQLKNAAMAMAAGEILIRRGTKISDQALGDGILKVRWPGRLELVCESPMVILDGAHNLAAAKNLAKYLAGYSPHKRITLVIGVLDDKPYKEILKALVPTAHRVVLTRPTIDRALEAETLYPIVREINPRVTTQPTVADAVAHALKTAQPDDLICIAGSLYVVGEAKAWFEKTRPFTV